MAKYINYNKFEESMGAEDTQRLLGLGLIKKGSGSALNLLKNGEFVSAPLEHEEKILAYLKGKLEYKPATPATPAPEKRISLCNTIGEGKQERTPSSWVYLMKRDNIEEALATKVVKALSMSNLTLAQKQRVREAIKGNVNQSWFKRVCKTLGISAE